MHTRWWLIVPEQPQTVALAGYKIEPSFRYLCAGAPAYLLGGPESCRTKQQPPFCWVAAQSPMVLVTI